MSPASSCLTVTYHPHPRFVGQLLLGPIEEAAGGPALRSRDHGGLLAKLMMVFAQYDEISIREHPLDVGYRIQKKYLYLLFQCLH